MTSSGPPLRTTRLAAGAEFDRIRAIIGESGSKGSDELRVGPGDDAAVLGDLVLSTDLTVEDVHFRSGWIGLPELGHRAVTVALSDLGAMGARPVAVLCSLALADSGLATVQALAQGFQEAVSEAGALLVGGDVSRSPGPLVIDVVAVGRTADPVLRSTATAGDDLWVTGVLGGAAAAVADWESGRVPVPALRTAFERPAPPLSLLGELREEGVVTAGLDLSDGLLGDAGHLAAASGVGIRIFEDRVPIHPALAERPASRRLHLALSGGEDYQILFTARPSARGVLSARSEGTVTLKRIGEVVDGSGVVRVGSDGRETSVESGGFDHFSGRRS